MWMPSLARMSSVTRCAIAPAGPETDHREVGGAAADVDDEHRLFARDRALVVERRRDRLELEFDVPKARGARARGERVLRGAVLLRVVVDEADRPSQHDGVERMTCRRGCAIAQRAQVGGDDVGVRVVARRRSPPTLASGCCRARSSASASGARACRRDIRVPPRGRRTPRAAPRSRRRSRSGSRWHRPRGRPGAPSRRRAATGRSWTCRSRGRRQRSPCGPSWRAHATARARPQASMVRTRTTIKHTRVDGFRGGIRPGFGGSRPEPGTLSGDGAEAYDRSAPAR